MYGKMRIVALFAALSVAAFGTARGRAESQPLRAPREHMLGAGHSVGLTGCLTLATQDSYVGPPAGFNPVGATDAELRCYGFPGRPTNPMLLPNWTRTMSHFKRWVQPKPLSTTVLPNIIASSSSTTRLANRSPYRARLSSVQPAAASRQTRVASGGFTHNTINAFYGGYYVTRNPAPPQGQVTPVELLYTSVIGHWTQQEEAAQGHGDGRQIIDWVGLGGIDGDGFLYQAGTSLIDATCGPLNIICGSPQYTLYFLLRLPQVSSGLRYL